MSSSLLYASVQLILIADSLQSIDGENTRMPPRYFVHSLFPGDQEPAWLGYWKWPRSVQSWADRYVKRGGLTRKTFLGYGQLCRATFEIDEICVTLLVSQLALMYV